MKRRTLSLVMACALSLTLLASCGSKGDDSSASGGAGSSQSGSSSSSDGSTPDLSTPDASQPDASMPDGSAPDASAPGTGTPPPIDEPQAVASLSLSKSDFTLKAAGATWKLKYTVDPVVKGTEIQFTSSDEKVATVAQDGTVTAVAPGTATITATYGELSAKCIVRCRWEEQKPDSSKPDTSNPDSSKPSTSDKVDLAAFYKTVSGDYEFPSSMQVADKQLMDAFYPGLSAISTEQCLVYANQMSMNMGEFVLVQVKNSKDVDAVKDILQSRIDTMVNGGAWYPEPTRVWSECSKVVSNGNYIIMVVNEEHKSIVDDFNGLF